jgi:hypothetical protein
MKKRKAEKQATGETKSSKKQPIIQSDSDSETDDEANVLDIVATEKKKLVGKRIPANIPPAPMDNISFHSEASVQKWKNVYQRRVAHERELSSEALGCKEVMMFLEAAGLMKTETNLGRCYEKLVKDFIVNITENYSDASEEFKNVYVRGKCVKFSTTIINEYLERDKETETEVVDLCNKVTEEIT